MTRKPNPHAEALRAVFDEDEPRLRAAFALLAPGELLLPQQDSVCPLHAAAHMGNLHFVRLLLPRCGRDEREWRGRTPLMLAAMGGHEDCLRLLLDHSDASLSDVSGMGAMALAAFHGHANCLAALIAAGCDPGAAANDGMTPLMLAAKQGYARCAEILLREPGSHPRAADKDGMDALMWACFGNSPECIAALAEACAPLRKDRLGRDACAIARKYSPEQAEPLLKALALIEQRNLGASAQPPCATHNKTAARKAI